MKLISVTLLFTIVAVIRGQPGYKYQQPQSAPPAQVGAPANHHHEHHHHHRIGPQPAAPIGGPILPPQQNAIFSPIQPPPLQSFNPPPAPQPVSIPLQPPPLDIQLPAPQAPAQLPQQAYLSPPQSLAVPSIPQGHQQQIVHHQVAQQQHHFGGAQLSQPIQQQQPQPLNFPSGDQGGFQQNFQSFQQRPQTAIITKDIYIHSAPEDQDESSLSQQLDSAPIRKNYRIVFIKAPTPNLKLATAALKHAQNVNEEKTVIYVLSKKPDLSEVQQQLQQAQGQQKAHKPEVYFIKYKTQEEAQRAQQEIQAQYDALGGSTHISDEGFAPVTSVSGGSVNLGAGIAQQHSSFGQQNFQSAGNYEGPNNKYLPIKKKK